AGALAHVGECRTLGENVRNRGEREAGRGEGALRVCGRNENQVVGAPHGVALLAQGVLRREDAHLGAELRREAPLVGPADHHPLLGAEALGQRGGGVRGGLERAVGHEERRSLGGGQGGRGDGGG